MFSHRHAVRAMVAPLRRSALLALGLLASLAAAFIPGVRVPHVKVSPPTPNTAADRGRSANIPGGEHTLAMSSKRVPGDAPNASEGTPSTPQHWSVRVMAVVDEWEKLLGAQHRVESQRRNASGGSADDSGRTKAIDTARNSLFMIRGDLSDNVPEYALALASGDGPGDIQAVATCTTRPIWDELVNSKIRVLIILELVTRPSDKLETSVKEDFIRRIVDWARTEDRLPIVSPDRSEWDLYTGLGFVRTDDFFPTFAFAGNLTGDALPPGPRGQEGRRMVTLELEPPRPLKRGKFR